MSPEPLRIHPTEAPALDPSPPRDDPLLIDRPFFAGLLSVSVPTLDRMRAAGKLPRHVALSRGCIRWRLDEVRDWVRAGCPPRKEWEARNRRS